MNLTKCTYYWNRKKWIEWKCGNSTENRIDWILKMGTKWRFLRHCNNGHWDWYLQGSLIILGVRWVGWPGLVAVCRVSRLRRAGTVWWFWAALDRPDLHYRPIFADQFLYRGGIHSGFFDLGNPEWHDDLLLAYFELYTRSHDNCSQVTVRTDHDNNSSGLVGSIVWSSWSFLLFPFLRECWIGLACMLVAFFFAFSLYFSQFFSSLSFGFLSISVFLSIFVYDFFLSILNWGGNLSEDWIERRAQFKRGAIVPISKNQYCNPHFSSLG